MSPFAFLIRFCITCIYTFMVYNTLQSNHISNVNAVRLEVDSYDHKVVRRKGQLANKEFLVFTSRQAGTGNIAQLDIDFALGTGRKETNVDQCRSTICGGRAAELDDKCDYKEWEKLRRPILDSLLQLGRYKGASYEQQFIENVGNFVQRYKHEQMLHQTHHPSIFTDFFKTYCVSCAREPYLQCNKQNKCVCWETYAVEGGKCKVRLNQTCDEFFGAECVENAYCNQTYKCECRQNKIPCFQRSAGPRFGPTRTFLQSLLSDFDLLKTFETFLLLFPCIYFIF